MALLENGETKREMVYWYFAYVLHQITNTGESMMLNGVKSQPTQKVFEVF
jgi:hypothetical protein